MRAIDEEEEEAANHQLNADKIARHQYECAMLNKQKLAARRAQFGL
jgi:hypothetical protein